MLSGLVPGSFLRCRLRVMSEREGVKEAREAESGTEKKAKGQMPTK